MAVISYKCPNCDGELVFDPATQNYKCPYCMSMFTQEELEKMQRAESTEQVDYSQNEMDDGGLGAEGAGHGESGENASGTAGAGTSAAGAGAGAETSSSTESAGLGAAGTSAAAAGVAGASAVGAGNAGSGGNGEAGSGSSGNNSASGSSAGGGNTEESQEKAVIYTCPSCGAEIVTDATTAATFCYYCHNPVVLGGRLEGKFLPNKIIPFQLDKKRAEQSFLDYVSHKRFVPKAFFDKKNIEKLSGVYFPYWLYSVELEGSLTAEAKKIRTWRVGNEEYTETKMYELTREGFLEMNNLPGNALKKANSKLAEGVLPYRFDELKDFHMGYLSGFLAEKRDIENKELESGAQQEMRKGAEYLMKNTTSNYSFVQVRNSGFRAKQEDWQYALLPVWTITYKGNDGKVYYYSMNGQTGKICGDLPIDKKKVALTAVGIFASVCAILLIGGFLL